MDNVVKECGEEAGMSSELARRARSSNTICYVGMNPKGELSRETLFCYDLKLPHDFTPRAEDKEVEEFTLLSMDSVVEIALGTSKLGIVKPNCTLVIVDFLIRHGFITPDDEGFLELLQSLRGT